MLNNFSLKAISILEIKRKIFFSYFILLNPMQNKLSAICLANNPLLHMQQRIGLLHPFSLVQVFSSSCTNSLISIDIYNGQRKLKRGCANAQLDLSSLATHIIGLISAWSGLFYLQRRKTPSFIRTALKRHFFLNINALKGKKKVKRNMIITRNHVFITGIYEKVLLYKTNFSKAKM